MFSAITMNTMLIMFAIIAAFGLAMATVAVLPIVQQAYAPRPADTEPEHHGCEIDIHHRDGSHKTC